MTPKGTTYVYDFPQCQNNSPWFPLHIEEQCKRNTDETKVNFESITLQNSEIHVAVFVIHFFKPAPTPFCEQSCTTASRI